MKICWHTKTLFIQWWKYKWSYKFNHCIKCLTCENKHKWKWLCTKCFDKNRDKNFNRKKVKLKAWLKYYQKHKWTDKEKIRLRNVAKVYYQKHKEALKIIQRVRNRLKAWKKCLKIVINWKDRYLPFENIEKPNCTTSNMNLYDEWREKIRQLDILNNYYIK